MLTKINVFIWSTELVLFEKVFTTDISKRFLWLSNQTVESFRFISCNVCSNRKAFQILDKVFLQFLRTSYIQMQFTVIKIFVSVNCTMTDKGISSPLHKFDKTCFTLLTFLLHQSLRWMILAIVTWSLSFATLFAESTFNWAATCGVFQTEHSL